MDTKKFIKLIQEVVRNEVRAVLKEELSKQSIKENYNPPVHFGYPFMLDKSLLHFF